MTSGEADGDREDSTINIEDVKWTETSSVTEQWGRPSRFGPQGGFIV
jgi:hypothetical protein